MVIASWSGAEPRRAKARRLLSDPTQNLVGSEMLALELLPHPTYSGNAVEVRFMSGFLARIPNVPIDAVVVARAHELGGGTVFPAPMPFTWPLHSPEDATVS